MINSIGNDAISAYGVEEDKRKLPFQPIGYFQGFEERGTVNQAPRPEPHPANEKISHK